MYRVVRLLGAEPGEERLIAQLMAQGFFIGISLIAIYWGYGPVVCIRRPLHEPLALEAIEAHLDARSSAWLIPLLADSPPAKLARTLSAPPAVEPDIWLQRLAADEHREPWLRACAVHSCANWCAVSATGTSLRLPM